MNSASGSDRLPIAILRLYAVGFLLSAMLLATLADGRGAMAQTTDYDEVFYSVNAETYDSDDDGYDDSVVLSMDVDTDGDYVDVAVDGELEDSYGFVVDSDSASWTIYDSETEWGQLQFTVSWGDPGSYAYYLYLYDESSFFFSEDSYSGSVYLYPTGYGDMPVITPTPRPTRTPTPTFGPGPGPDNGGFNWYVLVGIGIGGLLIAAGVMQRNRRIQRGKVAGARIGELRAQMEKWRREGYDVSDLEDLFK